MHHLETLSPLQLRVLAPDFNIPLSTVCLIGRFVALFRVLLLANVEDLQCLLNSPCHFVPLQFSIRIIFIEHLVMAILLALWTLLFALLHPLGYLCMGEFFIAEGLLLFVCMASSLLIFSSYCSSRSAISFSSLFRANSRSLFSYFSR
jgi:hypothetical protein